MKTYIYKAIHEDPRTGRRAKQCRYIESCNKLRIGLLYEEDPPYKGYEAFRPLKLVEVMEDDE